MLTYKQKETERVQEHGAGATAECGDDTKATRSKGNANGDPETTVGGERSGTEGVSDSHFPRALSVRFQ